MLPAIGEHDVVSFPFQDRDGVAGVDQQAARPDQQPLEAAQVVAELIDVGVDEVACERAALLAARRRRGG
jgi:hypothetical protein